MAETQSALELEALSVRLRARAIVHEVSFSLERGKLLALIGPNGAGKSTLLRAIAGLVPHEGRVLLDGAATPSDSSVRARALTYVPQQSRLDSPLRVRDVVALGRFQHRVSLFGMSAADERAIERAVAITDIAELAGRPFTALSLGEQRRVLVARALATESKLILLDEPDAFLDVRHTLVIEALLRRLADEGHTIVVVLHSLDLARRVCDLCALLHRGRLHAFGAPREVMSSAHILDTYGVRPLENAALGFALGAEER